MVASVKGKTYQRFPIVRKKPDPPPFPLKEPDAAIEYVNALWTDADISRVFGVTPNTVIVWRRDHGLPFRKIEGDQRPTIRYVPGEVRKWARKNNREMSE